MKKSENLKYSDKISIEKLIGEYNLMSTEVFPYTHCKVRIWHNLRNNLYYAHGNISIRESDGSYDGTCGIGKNEEDALDNYLFNFLNLVLSYEEKLGRKLDDEDYGYCDPHDF